MIKNFFLFNEIYFQITLYYIAILDIPFFLKCDNEYSIFNIEYPIFLYITFYIPFLLEQSNEYFQILFYFMFLIVLPYYK